MDTSLICRAAILAALLTVGNTVRPTDLLYYGRTVSLPVLRTDGLTVRQSYGQTDGKT